MNTILESKVFWLTLIFTAFYLYLKYYVYNYWKRHKIPHEAPSVPFGNIPWSFFSGRLSLGNLLKESHGKFKNHPFHGLYIFSRPVIIVTDLELIKTILVKEFSRFIERGWFVNEKVDTMSNNLFLQSAGKWKRLRNKFSPTFTPGRLRQMYPLIVDISDKMIEVCNEKIEKSKVLEVKDIIARYTIEIISSIVYGFNCNSLKEPNNEFRRLGLKAFDFGRFNMLVAVFLPEILEKITLPFYHKEVRDFFTKIFNEMVDHRRKENIQRNDFMNLLIQLVEKGELDDDEKSLKATGEKTELNEDDRVSMTDAASQAFVFFLAGFETSSSTVTYCLMELAMNPVIQEKLQQEIDAVMESSSGLTFDTLTEMEYLDMVFSETLRKYPSVAFLNRICLDDFPVPGSHYVIPKGMRIVISPPGVHYDPNLFPNPEIFDPSRFTRGSPAHSMNLAFGDGPRNCIGKRYGILQSKQALVSLLYNYTFSLSDKTEFPIEYVTESFVQTPKKGIYLTFEKRRK